MTCRELVEVITDYLEGRLPDPDRVRLEAHVEGCPYCEEYIAQMRRTIDALGELRREAIDPRLEAELLEAFRGWRRA
jgi:anti-sigma factor RsiW